MHCQRPPLMPLPSPPTPGLNYLHCQSPPLMHRDLKSPNVLLSEEGVAKIADVGMSRSQVGWGAACVGGWVREAKEVTCITARWR